MDMRIRSGLLFIAASLMATAALCQEPPCSAMTPGELQVVSETNAARASSGQAALTVDCKLMASARRHARRMARDKSLYHSNDIVGENVAVGPETAHDAVVVWLKSPGHRANIMGRSYRRIGVAGFIGLDGRAYWVQQFAP